MASNVLERPGFEGHEAERPARAATGSESTSLIRAILTPLASLRLTVTLFALAIFLVFAGTLELRHHGLWHVVEGIFRSPIAWIELRSFFPNSMSVPGGFWYPGGWLIGGVMFVNLLAAHFLRFKIRARGTRLATGLALIALGAAATAAVIYSGNNSDFEGELSPQFCAALWLGIKAALFAVWIGASAWLLRFRGDRRAAWWILMVLAQIIGALAIATLVYRDFRLNPSSLRILWQLAKATGAAIVLLAGCQIVFEKRGGIVLLHAGVALMMLGELFTGLWADEAAMQILNGETVNYVQDIRYVELAVIDQSAPDKDEVTVIPHAMVVAHAEDANADAQIISDDRLPFDIRIREFMINSELVSRDRVKDIDALANRGLGRLWAVEEMPVIAGSASGGEVDQPTAYVELFDKSNGDSLGTYLLNVNLQPQHIDVNGEPYALALRFERTYTPYSMSLREFRFDKYVGTGTAKNFSSDIHLVDPSRDVDRDVTIWMNNPLRYAGETFYQQSYVTNPQTGEEIGTTLQVVSNTSWMIPYTACMLVAVGMLAHFAGTLVRFLNRRHVVRESIKTSGPWAYVVPGAVLLLAVGYLGSKLRSSAPEPGAMRIDEAGQIPVAYEGRVKPLDTLARASMRFISNRDYFETETTGPDGQVTTEKRPAIEWLLDVISGSPDARDHKVFRIENLQVQSALGLEPRKRYRYALNEFAAPDNPEMRDRVLEFERVGSELSQKAAADKPLDANEKKHLDLMGHLSHYRMLEASFDKIERESISSQDDLERLFAMLSRLERNGVHAIPPNEPGGDWELLTTAEVVAEARNETNPATKQLRTILDAYRDGDAAAFNLALKGWREQRLDIEEKLASADEQANEPASSPGGVAFAETLNSNRVDFESEFNRIAPFSVARVFYVAAFLLACLGWIGWSGVLNRTALWLLGFTFVLHTAGIAAYVYISGRPPITNLYTSAVFVGWGCVLLGIVFEVIYGRGLGNLVASIAGFTTLLVSHYLGLDGDTIKVMQAVLDTNFWLALHVTCITFGYATTFVTGLFGVIYLVLGMIPGRLDGPTRDILMKNIYGTLCFATFFSFVGTVFGGLWADDSWGRFWGWDPKENGALIIVLWNVLVLHSRWAKLVGPRGLAILAVGGNIVTCWSWFGVNALGVGLHSYGFDSSTVKWLVIFVMSQLAVIGVGLFTKTRAGAESASA